MHGLAVHPEDIKATIRKKHGSMANFEAAKGLARRSVTDVLRGKPSRQTAEAIAAELGHTVETLFNGGNQSAFADCNAPAATSHRQNAEVR